MHEQDFRILEGQDITLPELGRIRKYYWTHDC